MRAVHLRADCAGEMPDAEHVNFERIGCHARAYYVRSARRPTRKCAAIIEKFSVAAHCTAYARRSLASAKLERAGCETDFE